MNKKAFDARAAEAMSMQKGTHDYNGIDIDPPTQADIDAVLFLLDNVQSTSGYNIADQKIWDIISEETAAFFAGKSSAQDAARIIQDRMSNLVSERS